MHHKYCDVMHVGEVVAHLDGKSSKDVSSKDVAIKKAS
jgi:hypothetical protein